MSHKRNISITAKTHESLLQKKKNLERKIKAAKKDLAFLARDEKEPNGNQPLLTVQGEIAWLQGQLEQTKDILANVNIVENAHDSVVTIGSKITIKLCNCDNSEEIVELLIDGVCGCGDTNVRIVTPQSPIGGAVIGAKVGDKCKCIAPKGDIDIIIISISHE